MIEDNKQNQTDGQTGIDQETERRNRENETGQQSQGGEAESGQFEAGQSQQQPTGQQGQSETFTGERQDNQAKTPGGEGGSGFVGSSGDQSSDYLTKGENHDFAPEGQGADQTSSGTADVETGQSSDIDATLDDGSDTSR